LWIRVAVSGVNPGDVKKRQNIFRLRAVSTRKGLNIRGYSLMEITRNPEKLPAAKKYVYDRLADGRFHPKVARIFPFAQAVEAYKYLESNAQEGRVVITVP
jgi:NADPH:quinone reductase-like Zn-dependent oxidoreductase